MASTTSLENERVQRTGTEPVQILNQFYEDHLADMHFFYTGKRNVLGLEYADAIVVNSRNAHYMRIATITYDETLQSSEENIINEEINVKIENYISSQYMANNFTLTLIGHVAGKRVSKNKFKCIVTPEIDYTAVPEIYITEEINSGNYSIGVWMHTEGIKRIFMWKTRSEARNSTPVNTHYIDSRYYINLLNNDNITYDVDTSNLIGVITKNQFAAGYSIYTGIINRLAALESISYPEFKFAIVESDRSWTPTTTGTLATASQRIPLSTVDYGTGLSSPFIRIETNNVNGFTVNDNGLYLVQIINNFNTRSAIEDNDVELSLYKNNDIVPGTTMTIKLRANNGSEKVNQMGYGGAFTMLNLKNTDIVRLQFKFINPGKPGIINEGSKIQVMKLLQMP